MTLNTLDGRAITVSKGTMRVISAPGALAKLPGIVNEAAAEGDVAVLCDATVNALEGSPFHAVLKLLPAGRSYRTVVARESAHGVVLDEETVATASAEALGASVVVAVGSGTVSDLGKIVASAVAAPLVLVQTAASVNGFADPLSVLVLNGAKRTVPSIWPTVLVIDHDVISAAPPALARAGVGDAVAAWCAPADWYLACQLGMDPGPYDDRFVAPVQQIAPQLADAGAAPEERMAALIEVLTVGGLVIGDAGTTAPLSGVEHLISHVLDMAAMAEGGPHDLHGAQVGAASILSTALWDIALHDEDILQADFSDFAVPADLQDRVLGTWHSVDPSGELGEECWKAVNRKMERWAALGAAGEAFFARRSIHRQKLKQLAGNAGAPAKALELWGAPTTFSTLRPPVPAGRARWALSALPFMRDRLTLADLFVLRDSWNDGLFDRVFSRAVTLGGGL